MKAIEKIVIAGIVGTTFMTLYSYFKAKKENEEYVEPVMLNKLIDKSPNLPSARNEDSHPAGWGLHYGTGVVFVAAYWLFWKKVLLNPTPGRVLVTGIISGAAGILVWKLLFSQHSNPPHNDRKGYYRQLMYAHIIFSLFSLLTYKALSLKEETTAAVIQ
ncbi:hypothetical protein HYN59_16335 [Flavobacterium album]|uniref:DUF2938 domain-containing protein n=1 Tax=Flavobacterium album TaxID=2175091 RepID=A0A2S1R1M6_9FLAO|nr:hypothetical protein [Flavobacterium album]AWH86578.1 hypothetical protein HYN59_16335 [Flavobacterium album]